MYKNEDADVGCPYYNYETKQAVHCEGVQDGIGLRLGFISKPIMNDYKSCFCKGQWKGCMIAKMLNAKYDYEP